MRRYFPFWTALRGSPRKQFAPKSGQEKKQKDTKGNTETGKPKLIARPLGPSLRPKNHINPDFSNRQQSVYTASTFPSMDKAEQNPIQDVRKSNPAPYANVHGALKTDDISPPQPTAAKQSTRPALRPVGYESESDKKISQPKALHSGSSNPAIDQTRHTAIGVNQDVLTVRNLTIRSNKTTHVERIEFTLKKGELVGLAGMGAKACEALFATISGTKAAEEGRIEIDHKSGADVKTTQQIGWLRLHSSALQQSSWPLLGDDRSGHVILQHAARLLGLNDPEETAERFARLIGLTGASPQSYGWELPYRIRLATALSLMPNPRLLLADFPTRDLSPENAKWVWRTLEQFHEDTGATILIASNDLTEIERLCDRMILFSDRYILADAMPSDLLHRFGQNFMRRNILEPASLDR